jgi:hypothetical protein
MPSDDLIGLLRNTHFQESIFIDTDGEHRGLKWPKVFIFRKKQSYYLILQEQRDSLYPNDLIQLWDDRTWIADLTFQLSGCTEFERIRPAFKFDSIYATIFSEYPNVLLFVRALILNRRIPWQSPRKSVRAIKYPLPPSPLWDILHLSFSTLKPFLVLRDIGYSCSQGGDSPLDFLEDPDRAGSFYSPPEQILEQWMLFWVRFAKQPLDSSGEMLNSIRLWVIFGQQATYNYSQVSD